MRYLKEATATATSGVLKIHCACGVLGPWVCQRPLGFWVLNPVSRAPGAIGFLGPPMARHARARIPNDVRAREGDYFVGSRAPQTQGR